MVRCGSHGFRGRVNFLLNWRGGWPQGESSVIVCFVKKRLCYCMLVLCVWPQGESSVICLTEYGQLSKVQSGKLLRALRLLAYGLTPVIRGDSIHDTGGRRTFYPCYRRHGGLLLVFNVTNLKKWAQPLGDLNFQRAFRSDNKQRFWDLGPSISICAK